MKKRVLFSVLSSILISLVIVIAVNATAGYDNFKKTGEYTTGQFVDVNSDAWYYQNVKSVFEYGLMIGKGEGTFAPGENITYAEAVTIASRIHSIYTDDGHEFEATNPWYMSYVNYAVDNEIITDNQISEYNTEIDRAEFVGILAHSLPDEAWEYMNEVADDSIPDVKTGDKCSAEIYKLYRAGIVIGNDEIGTFSPDRDITRAEVAAIITRIADSTLRLEIVKDKGEVKETASENPKTESVTDTKTDDKVESVTDIKSEVPTEEDTESKNPATDNKQEETKPDTPKEEIPDTDKDTPEETEKTPETEKPDNGNNKPSSGEMYEGEFDFFY